MASTRSNELDGQYYDTSEVRLDLTDGVPTGEDALYDYDHLPSQGSSTAVQKRARYEAELRQIEDEIQTLRQVLMAKYRRYNFLKSQLGITVISELRSEVNKGVENLISSETFQKTSAVVKSAKEKTSAVLFDKWQALKQTNTFKSLEDKVEAAYSTVRGKLIRPTTITGLSQPAQLTTSSEKIDDGLSNQNGHTGKSDTPLTSTAIHHNSDVSAIPVVSPPKNSIRLDSLSTDSDADDEVSEFASPTGAALKRGDKPKYPTLPD